MAHRLPAMRIGVGDAVQLVVEGLLLGDEARLLFAQLLQFRRVVGGGGFHDGEAGAAVGAGHLYESVVHAAGQENRQDRRVFPLHLGEL